MATPETTHYKNDPCYGDSDPDGNIDSWNRYCKYVWGNFTNYDTEYGSGTGEHDADGDHMSDLLSLFWKCEAYTWTGNGADDRNLSLSDGDLDVKFIRVWEASTAGTWFKSEDMAGDTTFDTLKEVDYDGWLVIEAFGQALEELAAATKIWRRMFEKEEQLAQEGLGFLKQEVAKRWS